MAKPFQTDIDRYDKLLSEYNTYKQSPISPIVEEPEAVSMSDEGFESLREHESFRPDVYEDQAGHPTVGYGHKLSQEEIDTGVYNKGISQDKANELMKSHPTLNNVTKAVGKMKTELNTKQRDALISAGYNIGPTAIKKVIQTIEEKGLEAGAERLKRYNKVRKNGKLVVSSGLSNRRSKEASSLIGEKKMNPKILQYMQNVSRRTPQAFADGGVYDPENYTMNEDIYEPELAPGPFDAERYPTDYSQFEQEQVQPEPVARPDMPAEPTPEVENPYEFDINNLMEDLSKEKISQKEAKAKNKKLNALLQLSDAFTKYSTNKMQGDIQAKARTNLGFNAAKSSYQPVKFDEKPSVMKDALEKAKLLQQYKTLQDGDKKGMTEYQKFQAGQKVDSAAYKKEQDTIDNLFKEKQLQDKKDARKEKGLGGGSKDPNSEESKLAREKAFFLTGRTFPETFTEADIMGMKSALGRKITTGYQQDNLDLREQKFKLAQIKERRVEDEQERNFNHKVMVFKSKFDRLAPKEADRYESLVNEQRYVDRIDKLFKAVKTGKKHYYKDLIKNWIPEADHDEAFVKLNTLTGQSLFAYIKNISGAQFSDAERVRFEELMPGVGDNPTKARAKIVSWRKTLKQRREVFGDRLRIQKIDLPNLWQTQPSKFSADRKQATIDKVKAARPEWSDAQVEAALKKKYGSKW